MSTVFNIQRKDYNNSVFFKVRPAAKLRCHWRHAFLEWSGSIEPVNERHDAILVWRSLISAPVLLTTGSTEDWPSFTVGLRVILPTLLIAGSSDLLDLVHRWLRVILPALLTTEITDLLSLVHRRSVGHTTGLQILVTCLVHQFQISQRFLQHSFIGLVLQPQ